MFHEAFDMLPLWVEFLCMCVLTGGALEGGYRLGRWRHQRARDEKESSVGAMVASILGLLGFMLAFTFGAAATRFDARRQAILEESNAIGTCYLRTRLLPEPEQSVLAGQLRDYVDARLRAVQQGQLDAMLARSLELQDEMWTQAIQAAKRPDANPVLSALFIQSLNETIDVHSKRVLVGIRSRIPTSIWVCLMSLAVLGMAAVGYQSGIAETRRSPAMPVMILAFTGVLYVIADLDRAHEGFLQVGQGALLDLQKSMKPSKS